MRIAIAGLIMAVGLAGCGSGSDSASGAGPDESAAATDDIVAESSADAEQSEATRQTVVRSGGSDGNDPRLGETTIPGEQGAVSSIVESTTTTAPPAEIDVNAQGLRVVPVGAMVDGLLLWDETSARKQGHDGVWSEVVAGSHLYVVDVPTLGTVYQTQEFATTIWLATEDGPQELLVATEDGDTLELEGAGFSAAGEPVIFYQRRNYSSPDTALSTVRGYNVDTGEVVEIEETGGWESGTRFAYLTGGSALGLVSAEAFGWQAVLDLDGGGWTPIEEDATCFDGGDETCHVYDMAVMVGTDALGFAPIYNDAEPVQEFGLYSFTPGTLERELLASFDWDNNTWYITDMFLLGTNLVVSLADYAGSPLPALVYDTGSGESWTLPQAAFAVPSFLS